MDAYGPVKVEVWKRWQSNAGQYRVQVGCNFPSATAGTRNYLQRAQGQGDAAPRPLRRFESQMGPVWIRHCSHHFATQSSHSVDSVDSWVASQNGFLWNSDTTTVLNTYWCHFVCSPNEVIKLCHHDLEHPTWLIRFGNSYIGLSDGG